ncbi:Transcription initiation factor IIA subunit 2, partial [Caligus rogercresseyi]
DFLNNLVMLIKVKTLTGKEIEIDIEPTDKVERIKERTHFLWEADERRENGAGLQGTRRIRASSRFGSTRRKTLNKSLLLLNQATTSQPFPALLSISVMSYQLYRNTTLGHTLRETLDELMQMQLLTPALALKVLLQFDRSINNALNTRVKTRLNFKADKLNTYRFCDNVWTFMLNDVEFKEVSELAKVDRVKIVACDAKSALTTRFDD